MTDKEEYIFTEDYNDRVKQFLSAYIDMPNDEYVDDMVSDIIASIQDNYPNNEELKDWITQSVFKSALAHLLISYAFLKNIDKSKIVYPKEWDDEIKTIMDDIESFKLTLDGAPKISDILK